MSYQAAESLAPVWPVMHVVGHPMNSSSVVGQCNVLDEDVAPWVAANELVLVTIDTGFLTKWVKTGLLRNHGVEVIVFSRDLKGLREQHGRIVKHLPHWIEDLGQHAYGYRVWEQTEKLRPTFREGSKKKLNGG